MQQAEGLFQFEFSVPVYENLIVSLVIMSATSCAVPLIMLCAEAIYSLFVNIKVLHAVVLHCTQKDLATGK